MRGEVDADEFFLFVEPLDGVPTGYLRQGRVVYIHLDVEIVEERVGVGGFVCLPFITVVHQQVESRFAAVVDAEELLAVEVLEALESTCLREVLDGLAVAGLQVHALQKIEDIFVFAVLLALFDDGFRSTFADTFDAAETEPDSAFLIDREGQLRLVHVRLQDTQTERFAFVHQLGHLLDIVLMHGEVRRHELCRVMGFEVTRLISYPRVASRMRFIEGIGRKFLPVLPDFRQHFRVVTIRFAAVHELDLQRLQNRHLLLSHRLTELVALAAGEVRQEAAQKHHLLLINGHAISVLEVFLHHGDVVRHGLQTLLAADELRNIIHRSRTVERVHGDEVANDGRLQLPQVFLHTGGLELKDRYRPSFLEELISHLVVDGYMVDVDIDALRFLDVSQTLFDDRQGDEAEEVHLDQTHRLHHMPVVFGHEHTFLTILILHGTQRREVCQVVRSDDYAAGVYTYLPNRTFQPRRVVQHRPYIRIAVRMLLFEFGDVLIAVLEVHFGTFGIFRQVLQ